MGLPMNLASLINAPDAFSREVEAELCRRSLAYFVRKAWPVVEPGVGLDENWHIDIICEHLQLVTSGVVPRLIINIPPGHMKSLLVSVFWPAWEWTNNPHIKSQFGSGDETLALRDSVRTRDLIASEWYRDTFRPNWILKRDANAKGYFVNTAQGFRRTFTTSGNRVIGHRADRIVMDDPLGKNNQYNTAVKDHCLWIWNKGLKTRTNDPRVARFVLIMQRLAYDDLSGHLIIRNEKIRNDILDEGFSGDELALLKEILRRGGYDVICLPSEFEPERRSATSTGWSDPRTHAGELLFPVRYTQVVLDDLRLDLGSDGFAGEYQQRPSAAEGSAFKTDWFRHWIMVDENQRIFQLDFGHGITRSYRMGDCRLFSTVDSAVGIKRQNDPSVFAIWLVTPDSNLVLLDRQKGRWQEPDTVAVARRVFEQWRKVGHGFYFGVESIGIGKPLAQNMQRAGLPVVEIPVHQDKMVMSTTARIRCEAGQVYFPLQAAWLPEWESQLSIFPNGQHDEEVTVISLASEQVYGSMARTGKPTAVPTERRSVHEPRGGSGGSAGQLVSRPVSSGQETGGFGMSREEWNRR